MSLTDLAMLGSKVDAYGRLGDESIRITSIDGSLPLLTVNEESVECKKNY